MTAPAYGILSPPFERTALLSAERTVDTNGPDITNPGSGGGVFTIDVSNIAGAAPSIIPTIQGKDPVSGNYYNILVGPSILVQDTVVMRVIPGILDLANFALSEFLPKIFRIKFAHLNTDEITYSVGVTLT